VSDSVASGASVVLRLFFGIINKMINLLINVHYIDIFSLGKYDFPASHLMWLMQGYFVEFVPLSTPLGDEL
jgi:hypothetical protein